MALNDGGCFLKSPKVAPSRGFVFCNCDPDAVDLVTYLAGAREYLDLVVDSADGEMEIVKGPQGEGAKAVGIVALKGGNLLLCYAAMGGETPTEFATKAGSGLHLFVLKRKK